MLALLGAVALGSAVPVRGAWTPISLVTAEARAGGAFGGEGGQVVLSIGIDATGNFLLFGTDVGGLYRSLDGGQRWEPANVGLTGRGVAGIAIDPHASDRALVVVGNSLQQPFHGLFLTTDRGATWRSVLARNLEGFRDFREQIAFDPSSASGGMSRVAYWSSHADGGGGLFKSTDGGATWRQIQSGFGDSSVKVHPTRGTVYLGRSDGLWRSLDGGATFSRTMTGAIGGLDVVSSRPDHVYANKSDGAWVSTDGGASFARRANSGLASDANLKFLKVSPADPNRMLLLRDAGTSGGNNIRYFSRDGGASWGTSTIDRAGQFIPFNNRTSMFAWHPVQAQTAWTFTSDTIFKTTDGGARYVWANDGYTGICGTGWFAFNPFYPDVFVLSSQDYNSALTTNRGQTWTYLNVSGLGWGGFNYGAYAASPSVLVVGNSTTWGGTRTLRVSRNGGQTWTDTGKVGSGYGVVSGDPRNANVIFWNQWRSSDLGVTWNAMSGCSGVTAFNPVGSKELYGFSGNRAVRSYDSGATWQTVGTLPETVIDVAFDHARGRVYACGTSKKFYQVAASNGAVTEITGRLTADNLGNRRVKSVAVDPVDPAVVYVAYSGDTYMTSAALRRSTDAGETWTTLTRQPGGQGVDGGREAGAVRVHPVTREPWVTGGCFGLWRHAAPGAPPSWTTGGVTTGGNSGVTTGSATTGGSSGATTGAVTTGGNSGAGTTGTASGGGTTGTGDWTIPEVANAPGGALQIDGVLEAAWNGAGPVTIRRTIGGAVSNDADLSGSARALWDAAGVWLYVAVSDDALRNDSGAFYQDDSVEIFVDVGNDKATSYGANDYQFWVELDGSAGEARWGRSAGMRAAVRQRSGGYDVEVLLPWSTLGTSGAIGTALGIDVQINDDDSGGTDREGKRAWWASDDTAWNNPSVFGLARLAGAVPGSTTGNATGGSSSGTSVTGGASTGGTSAGSGSTGGTSAGGGSTGGATGVGATSGGGTAGGVWTIAGSAGPLVSDGVEEVAWAAGNAVTLSRTIVGSAVPASDMSATARALWTASGVFVFVKVTDDAVRDDSAAFYQDDSVEIYFDIGNDKGTSYGADDFQYWVDTSGAAGETKSNRMTGVIGAARIRTGGYDVELFVPWSTLGGAAVSGTELGMDVHVNDDDTGGDDREGKMAWAAAADTAWQDPSAFGVARLGTAPASGTGLSGRYFEGIALAGLPVLDRVDPTINFAWGSGGPGAPLGSDQFSVRWLGSVEAPVAGAYQLETTSDDGVRLWVDNVLVIDQWTDHPATVHRSGAVTLAEGQRVAVRLEYYEKGGQAEARLRWLMPGASTAVTIPRERLYPESSGSGSTSGSGGNTAGGSSGGTGSSSSSGGGTTGGLASFVGPATFLDGAEIERMRARVQAGQAPWSAAWSRVLADANAQMGSGYFSVVKNGNASGGNVRNFYAARPGGDRGDYSEAIAFGAAVRDCALAFTMSGEARYADRAMFLLKKWMVDPATAMIPESQGDNGSIDLTVTLPGAIYGYNLIQNHPGWSPSDKAAVEAWIERFAVKFANLNWIGQNYANWEVLAGMMAATVVERRDLFDKTVARWKALVPDQINSGGFMRHELERTTSFSYSHYAINAMIQAAEIARHQGVDLYNYRLADGRGLERVLDVHAPYAAGQQNWPHRQDGGLKIDNMALYELAFAWKQKPNYLAAVNRWGRPIRDGRIMGWNTLTHGR